MYGYCCINLTLQDQDITTGRGMTLKTFVSKGLDYVSDLALKNITDLRKIIIWNHQNNINLFRISSDLFPWHKNYKLSELKDYSQICEILLDIGNLSKTYNQRLTFHPNHFNKLCSSDETILQNTIKDLEHHSEVFDLMGFEPSHYNKINIHIGGAYNNKIETVKVFCNNFKLLSNNLQKRLTVENDDKPNLYSVKNLYDMIYTQNGIPIVFDYFHHKFNTSNLNEQEAQSLAISTWNCIRPVVHYSESKDGSNAHSDYIENVVDTYNKNVDVVIEAKAKELALLKRRK
jgi:UV DNA damage endonuclease